jgi:hypothetical protein
MARSTSRRWFIKSSLAASCTLSLTQISIAQSVDRFVGNLLLRDLDPEGRSFTLDEPFGYIDPSGTRWQAEKGLVTDGASIPWPLWSIVGGPFEDKYRRAAVIHDFYCDRKYRAWERVHRVFYDAMITAGVSPVKAKMMYYAVWRFGPRWSVTEIVPCIPKTGSFCNAGKPTSLEVAREKPVVEEKDVPEAKSELGELEARLGSEELSLDQLERLADSKPTIAKERTITRRTVVATTPLGRYEDFRLSDTTTNVPENAPIPGLFPDVRR